MRVEKVSLDKTGSFSQIFLDYLASKPDLAHTHSFEPTIQGFEKALSYRKLSEDNRNTLVEVLNEQYTGLTVSESVEANINLLKEQNAFTVTTGHQLNIFTGPLFFIYKIVTTINICRELAEKFPEYSFVPVYWMASEDHDFEEINHTYVDGDKFVWETEQTGAVGRFTTKELATLAESIPGKIEIFKKAYANSENLADAARHYVNELFGETGLVVVDADHRALKAEFKSIMKAELLNQSAFEKVNERSEFLINKGYKPQLNPREINLFYLDEGLRARIEKEGDSYIIVDTDLSFSEDEILALLDEYPEKFSPNVILWPVYQEVILPNLGYVGGPAELAYWLQFKEMFDFFKIDFPVLMPRNFGLYVDKNAQRKEENLGLTHEDLFAQVDALKKKYVHARNGKLRLEKERGQVEKLYKSINDLALKIDTTLEDHIQAQYTKHQQCLDRIETKLVKAEKRNREDEMRMINELKEYAFPGGTLQERKVNFLSINDNNFIEDLLKLTDPFDLRMNIYLE
jgi:bacillithiol biosynthesis cysteine-adding enzyme BshC